MLKNICHFVSVYTSRLGDDKNIRLNLNKILKYKIIMQIKNIYLVKLLKKPLSFSSN